MDTTMTGIVTMPIGKVVDTLVPLYQSGEELPTVMLWGPPGVGKSDGVEQIAQRLRESTGKTVHVYDLRLLLFNPVDLRGIPVPDEERVNAIWLRPGVLPPSENSPEYDKDALYILFLDEITAAPPSVQAAAYQLTLNRRIGEHVLPKNTIIIAAGNRVTDKGVAYKMPTPLANRMLHLNISVDFDSWKDWAIPNGVHQWVLSFLNMGSGMDLFKFDPTSDSVAFATPRSWMFVSKLLDIYKGNIDQAYPMIAGAIGEGMAIKFKAFVENAAAMPSIDAIISGQNPSVPDRPDVLYAVSGAIVARAAKLKTPQLANVIKWLTNVQEEFSVLTVRDILRLNNTMSKTLTTIPEYRDWVKKHKHLIV